MNPMNQCKVMKDANGVPTGVIVSPRGKMLYPALWEASAAKGETDPTKARYGLTILLHKDADLKPMADRVAALIGEKPFLKVTEEDQPKVWHRLVSAGLDPLDYPVMMRCFSKVKPTTLGPNAQPVADDTQAYDGRWCRVSINFYYYDHATGGKGISAGLNNVQLLDNDEVIPRGAGGGNANDEFEAVDSGGSADSVFD
jgi:Protein of unknown function (DUF2815)